jgi:hypothetical protein
MNVVEYAELKKDPVKYREYLNKINADRRWRYKTDPEYKKKIKQYYINWVTDPEKKEVMSAKRRTYQKKRYREDPAYRKKVYEHSKRWRDSNYEQYVESRNRSLVCNILSKHVEHMHKDPEHLQTDFLIMLINRDDKK